MNTFQIFVVIVVLVILIVLIAQFLFRNYGAPCKQCEAEQFREYDTDAEWAADHTEETAIVVEEDDDSESDISEDEIEFDKHV